jgi:hypothetical protein
MSLNGEADLVAHAVRTDKDLLCRRSYPINMPQGGVPRDGGDAGRAGFAREEGRAEGPEVGRLKLDRC